MKAAVFNTWGGPEVLEIKEIPVPRPKANEVLVRVKAASLNALDWRLIRGKPHSIRLLSGVITPRDQVIGRDLAGIIEAVGSGVTELKIGDKVCGVAAGSIAEYARAKVSDLVLKPRELSYEFSASLPVAGLTALHALRSGNGIAPGQKLLVIGASGGVGTFAVQIGRHIGAHVTGTSNTEKVKRSHALKIDKVIDHTRYGIRNAGSFDFIVDNAACYPLSQILEILNPSGTYALVGARNNPRTFVEMISPMLTTAARGIWSKPKLVPVVSKMSRHHLSELTSLVLEGHIRPAIGQTVDIENVQSALAALEAGQTFGKTVVVL